MFGSIRIVSSEVKSSEFKADDGRIFVTHRQDGVFEYVRDGQAYAVPIRVRVAEGERLPVGAYSISSDSIEVYNGSLQLSRILKLIPEG